MVEPARTIELREERWKLCAESPVVFPAPQCDQPFAPLWPPRIDAPRNGLDDEYGCPTLSGALEPVEEFPTERLVELVHEKGGHDGLPSAGHRHLVHGPAGDAATDAQALKAPPRFVHGVGLSVERVDAGRPTRRGRPRSARGSEPAPEVHDTSWHRIARLEGTDDLAHEEEVQRSIETSERGALSRSAPHLAGRDTFASAHVESRQSLDTFPDLREAKGAAMAFVELFHPGVEALRPFGGHETGRPNCVVHRPSSILPTERGEGLSGRSKR